MEPENFSKNLFLLEKILNLDDEIHTKFTIVLLRCFEFMMSCGITRKMTVLEFGC